jgi:acetyltransferase-like isoleucine patch superfamily enzyme
VRATVIQFIRVAKRSETYVLDDRLATRALLAELCRRGRALARAQWTLRGVQGSRLRFAERGCELRHRQYLCVGRGTVIEAYARLHCLSSRGFVIGNNVTIGKFAILECTSVLWHLGVGLTIGDNSSVGDWSFVGCGGGVTIGERVLMGQRVAIHAQNHRFDRIDVPIQEQGVSGNGITIGDDCWLGSGAVILDGVNLGNGSVVGAGAVVTRSFPTGSVIAGNPAKLVRTRI